jgi:hypothetical protein
MPTSHPRRDGDDIRACETASRRHDDSPAESVGTSSTEKP